VTSGLGLIATETAIVIPTLTTRDDESAFMYLAYLDKNLLSYLDADKSYREIWCMSMKQKNKKFKDNNVNVWGLRNIPGNRIEIFIKNKDCPKGSPASKALAEHIEKNECIDLPLDFWDQIIDYAKESARQDRRIEGYEFGPFSLIISTGNVPAQTPHIDVLRPNYQFTLMVSNDTPGTKLYKSINPNPVRDARTFVEWLGAEPDSKIADVLKKDKGLCDMLEKYGIVLDGLTERTLIMDGTVKTEALRRGATISIPGSLVHAGPSCGTFRAMIFFIASPVGQEKDAYKTEEQWSHGSMMIDLVSGLLLSPLLVPSERMLLLQKLHKSAQRYPTPLYDQVDETSLHGKLLKDFMITLARQTTDKQRKNHMEKFLTTSVKKWLDSLNSKPKAKTAAKRKRPNT
jgi:hypothetical protein